MNLNKMYEFFQPEKYNEKIHIVGCGSVGSSVAENLARCGLRNFVLWDFDTVEEKNIVNQMFTTEHIGMKKTDALASIILKINDEASVETHEGWEKELMSGYIFLCVDSIEIRKQIVERHMKSPFVKAMFDFRTMLKGAQHYAADWNVLKHKNNFLKTMEFSHEEAVQATPTSACGEILGVATTVRIISAYGVNNFINFLKDGQLKTMILAEAFDFETEHF